MAARVAPDLSGPPTRAAAVGEAESEAVTAAEAAAEAVAAAAALEETDAMDPVAEFERDFAASAEVERSVTRTPRASVTAVPDSPEKNVAFLSEKPKTGLQRAPSAPLPSSEPYQPVKKKIAVPSESEEEENEDDDRIKREKAHNHMLSRLGASFRNRTLADMSKDELIAFKSAKYILDPSHMFRRIWSASIMCLVAYTAVALPWQLAFQPEEQKWFRTIEYSLDFIFFLDVLANFRFSFTDGEHRDAILVRNPRIIARKYLTSWFVVDFVSCIPFDLFFGRSQQLELISAIKCIRLMRMRRFLDLFKTKSSKFASLFAIVRLYSFIIVFSHWSACIWFAMVSHGTRGSAWLEGAGILNADLGRQYTTSYSHTLTLLLRTSPHRPETALQEIFTVVMVLLGAYVQASVFGQVAHLVSSLNAQATTFRRQLRDTFDRMEYHHFPSELQARIGDYFETLWDKHRLVIGEESLAFTSSLSEPLRVEVNLYMNRRLIAKVPMFRECELSVIIEVISCLVPLMYMPGEYVVRAGEIGDRMFFIRTGACKVLLPIEGALRRNSINDSRGRQLRTAKVLEPGDYFGEISLLYRMERTATICAAKFSDISSLNHQDFETILTNNPEFAVSIEKQFKRYLDTETGHQAESSILDTKSRRGSDFLRLLKADDTRRNRRYNSNRLPVVVKGVIAATRVRRLSLVNFGPIKEKVELPARPRSASPQRGKIRPIQTLDSSDSTADFFDSLPRIRKPTTADGVSRTAPLSFSTSSQQQQQQQQQQRHTVSSMSSVGQSPRMDGVRYSGSQPRMVPPSPMPTRGTMGSRAAAMNQSNFRRQMTAEVKAVLEHIPRDKHVSSRRSWDTLMYADAGAGNGDGAGGSASCSAGAGAGAGSGSGLTTAGGESRKSGGVQSCTSMGLRSHGSVELDSNLVQELLQQREMVDELKDMLIQERLDAKKSVQAMLKSQEAQKNQIQSLISHLRSQSPSSTSSRRLHASPLSGSGLGFRRPGTPSSLPVTLPPNADAILRNDPSMMVTTASTGMYQEPADSVSMGNLDSLFADSASAEASVAETFSAAAVTSPTGSSTPTARVAPASTRVPLAQRSPAQSSRWRRGGPSVMARAAANSARIPSARSGLLHRDSRPDLVSSPSTRSTRRTVAQHPSSESLRE